VLPTQASRFARSRPPTAATSSSSVAGLGAKLASAVILLALAGCQSGGSDTAGWSSDGSFAGNAPPTISGTPDPTVMIGGVYDFAPIASDADGDKLTFSIANKPSWATFDPTTGRLGGQPGPGDEGRYEEITISVSDGTSSVELQPFSIEVVATAPGSMVLSWTAPTENEDGSPLEDLAGFRIYWGTTPDQYPNSLTIDNPSIDTYVIEGLLPETYYVVATAFNAAGVESRYSNQVTKTVDAAE
jgi:hypothetical protein